MLTEQQRLERRKGIGASEIGMIARVSNHGNLYDLWAEKCGLVEPKEDTDETLAGHFLEEGAARFYEYKTKRRTWTPKATYVAKTWPFARATPDRLVLRKNAPDRFPDYVFPFEYSDRIAEIKLAGRWAKGWDFSSNEGLPEGVICQVQWQMMVIGIHECDVFAVAGTQPRIFEVSFDESMAKDLLAIAEEFWVKHVLTGTPPEPDGSEAADRAIRAKWARDNGAMLPATPYARDLVDNLRELKRREKEAKEATDRVAQILKLHIGDASGIDGLCTYKANERGNVAWKEVADQFLTLALAAAGDELGASVLRSEFDRLCAENRGTPARKLLLKGEK